VFVAGGKDVVCGSGGVRDGAFESRRARARLEDDVVGESEVDASDEDRDRTGAT